MTGTVSPLCITTQLAPRDAADHVEQFNALHHSWLQTIKTTPRPDHANAHKLSSWFATCRSSKFCALCYNTKWFTKSTNERNCRGTPQRYRGQTAAHVRTRRATPGLDRADRATSKSCRRCPIADFSQSAGQQWTAAVRALERAPPRLMPSHTEQFAHPATAPTQTVPALPPPALASGVLRCVELYQLPCSPWRSEKVLWSHVVGVACQNVLPTFVGVVGQQRPLLRHLRLLAGSDGTTNKHITTCRKRMTHNRRCSTFTRVGTSSSDHTVGSTPLSRGSPLMSDPGSTGASWVRDS